MNLESNGFSRSSSRIEQSYILERERASERFQIICNLIRDGIPVIKV